MGPTNNISCGRRLPKFLYRELTAEETKRLSKLETIADSPKCGENVQNRQFQTWLLRMNAHRYKLIDKPSDLKRYEEKLKQAMFYYNRAEGYSSTGKHSQAKTFDNKSGSLCEDALETLQQIQHDESSLRMCFDRDISFEFGFTAGTLKG